MEKSVTQRVIEFLESIHLTVNGLSRVKAFARYRDIDDDMAKELVKMLE